MPCRLPFPVNEEAEFPSESRPSAGGQLSALPCWLRLMDVKFLWIEWQSGPFFTATVNQKAGKAGLGARVFYFSFYNECLVPFKHQRQSWGTFGLLEKALPTSASKEDKFIIIISYSREQQQSTKQQKETNIK